MVSERRVSKVGHPVEVVMYRMVHCIASDVTSTSSRGWRLVELFLKTSNARSNGNESICTVKSKANLYSYKGQSMQAN